MLIPYDEENDDAADYDYERFLYEINQERPAEPAYTEAELEEIHERFAALFS